MQNEHDAKTIAETSSRRLAEGDSAFSFVRQSRLTSQEFGERLLQSGIVTRVEIQNTWNGLDAAQRSATGLALALAEQQKLTPFQAESILADGSNPLILGAYVIEAKLGEGGMGQVYRAVHRKMKRQVALKVISPQAMKNDSHVSRFNREVEVAAQLTHPNIVTSHDAGEDQGIHYLVMEYVDGSDLAAVVNRDGPLPFRDALTCVLQAARGLAYAHDRGVTHRDIKPSNLLRDNTGTVKILDMGLARLDNHLDGATLQGLTNTGMVMGTIDYMAPEQAFDAKTADARSDIYSLGCTMFFLFTGRPLFDGDTIMKRLLAHREQPIPKLSSELEDRTAAGELLPNLDQVFERMVAKSPSDRFTSMHEVASALEALLAASSSPTRASSDEAVTFPSSAAGTNTGPPPSPVGRQDHSGGSVLPSSEAPTPSSEALSGPARAAIGSLDDTLAVDGLKGPSPEHQDPENQASTEAETSTAGRTPPRRNRPSDWRRRSSWQWIAAGLAGILFLAVVVVKFRGPNATVIVELDPGAKVGTVEIDGNEIAFSPDDSGRKVRFQVDAGNHQLSILSQDGVKLTTGLGNRPLQIAAGETATVRAWVVPSEPEAVTASRRNEMVPNEPIPNEPVAKEPNEPVPKEPNEPVAQEPNEPVAQETVPDVAMKQAPSNDSIATKNSIGKSPPASLRSSDPASANASQETEADRRAAQWVLDRGGYLNFARLDGGPNQENWLGPDDALPAGPWHLTNIHLNEPKRPVSDDDLTHLAGLRQLRDLSLAGASLAGPGLNYLRESPLEVLNLSNAGAQELESAAYQALAQFSKLRSLAISNQQVTPEFVQQLSPLKELEVLNLYASASFNDEAAAHLPAVFPKLRSLDVSLTGITDAGVAHLSGLEQLEELFMVSDSVTANALKSLPALPSLRFVGLRGPLPEDALRESSKSLPLVNIQIDLPDGTRQVWRDGQPLPEPQD